MPLPSKNADKRADERADDCAAEANGTGRFGRARRLRRPAEFAAVLAAPRGQALRAARHWLAMTAAWFPVEAVPAVSAGPAAGSAAASAASAPVAAVDPAHAARTPARVRFGITVGKRNARRAVDRALVKRIVREAARRAAPALEAICARRGLRLDVSFRLKAARDRTADGAPSLAAWRRTLRAEAGALLQRLGRHLTGPDA